MYTCEADFCLSCPQAHSCDKSCGLPCAKGDGTGHRRDLQGEDVALIFPTDALNPPTCPLDLFMSRVEATTNACCADHQCPAGDSRDLSATCFNAHQPIIPNLHM